MRLEWPTYAFTSGVFLLFALSVQFLSLGNGAVVGLFTLLTVAYAWVAWVMVKRKAVLELHAYISCNSCGELTPSQGKYCMNCGANLQSINHNCGPLKKSNQVRIKSYFLCLHKTITAPIKAIMLGRIPNPGVFSSIVISVSSCGNTSPSE